MVIIGRSPGETAVARFADGLPRSQEADPAPRLAATGKSFRGLFITWRPLIEPLPFLHGSRLASGARYKVPPGRNPGVDEAPAEFRLAGFP